MADSSIDAQPAFTWEQVAPTARRFGDLELVKRLPSERDQNFLVRFKSSEAQAVFKVHNPCDSRDFVECQCLALELAAKRAPCQRLLRTESSEYLLTIEKCCCRALTFLPGCMLAEALQEVEDFSELFRAVGEAVGSVTTALLGFDHAAAHRKFVWDLQQCSEVVHSHLSDVQEQKQALLRRVFDHQFALVSHLLPQLRCSIVHNDPNDYNLVVNDGEVGVLDFGDMVYSYTCADAAIGMAYLLFHIPPSMPLVEGVLPFVKGFHSACTLQEAEMEALFHLAVCRVCTSVCMSAYQSKLEPENEYLLISAKPAWTLLERVDQEDVGHAKEVFKSLLCS